MKPDISFIEKPMDALGSRSREWIYPILTAALALMLMMYYLCRNMFAPTVQDRLLYFAVRAAVAMALLSIRLLPGKKPAELRLLVQSACWVIVSRIILGELKYTFDGEIYWAVMYFCIFGAGLALKNRQRNIFLTAVTLLLCGTLLLWGAAAVITVLKGAPLESFPMLSAGIRLKDQGSLVFVTMFGIHRNTSAVFFIPAICLMIYQCVRHRHWGWYVAAGVTIPVWYAVISLQHCRSAYLATAACLSLLLGHLAMRKLEKRSRAAGIAAAVVIAVLFTVILYSGFSGCSRLITRISPTPKAELFNEPIAWEAGRTAETAEAAEAAEAAAEDIPAEAGDPAEAEDPGIKINDTRSTVQDMRTLTGRTRIWKSLLPVLQDSQIRRYGTQYPTMMKLIREQLGVRVSHMHNILFQQTLMAGIPGGLLYLLFLLSLAVRIIKCYFRREGQGREESLVLGIALTGAMIYGVFEPLMSANKPVFSLIFCLLAGCFVGELTDEPGTRGVPQAD